MRFLAHPRQSPPDPFVTPLGDVGAALLGGLQCFFLNRSPCRISNRDRLAGAAFVPVSASRAVASSGMVMSRLAATRPSRKSLCGASLPTLPPGLPGQADPVRSKRWTSLTAQLALTAKRDAAPRRDPPLVTKPMIRLRRSKEYGTLMVHLPRR